jgi:hypothetical protein
MNSRSKSPPAVGRASTALAARGSPRPAIASRFQAFGSAGYSPLLATTGPACRLIHCRCDDHRLVTRPLLSSAGCRRRIHWPRRPPRQRSNVATLIPTSSDTKSIAELSGGSSLATIRSLYFIRIVLAAMMGSALAGVGKALLRSRSF